MTEAPIDISNPDKLVEMLQQIITENETVHAISIREMMTMNSICNTRHMMDEHQLVDSFIFMEHMLEQVRRKSGV